MLLAVPRLLWQRSELLPQQERAGLWCLQPTQINQIHPYYGALSDLLTSVFYQVKRFLNILRSLLKMKNRHAKMVTSSLEEYSVLNGRAAFFHKEPCRHGISIFDSVLWKKGRFNHTNIKWKEISDFVKILDDARQGPKHVNLEISLVSRTEFDIYYTRLIFGNDYVIQ